MKGGFEDPTMSHWTASARWRPRPTDPRLPLPTGSLQLLEQQVVGGEQAKNKDLKEKHKRRKRYADERKKQLVAALQNSDEDGGDWVLLNVYDSIQEEVRAKSKLLERMQRKVRPRRTPRWPQPPPVIPQMGIYRVPAVCVARPGGRPVTEVCLLCWASVCNKGTAEKQAG